MSLIGLDLNGTRVRAVIGPGEVPRARWRWTEKTATSPWR